MCLFQPLKRTRYNCGDKVDEHTSQACTGNGYLKDMIVHIIDQFFFTMTYCTKLVLSGRTHFEFMHPLLENHVENIQKIGSYNRAKVYQARVEPLGSYAVDLRNLKGA